MFFLSKFQDPENNLMGSLKGTLISRLGLSVRGWKHKTCDACARAAALTQRQVPQVLRHVFVAHLFCEVEHPVAKPVSGIAFPVNVRLALLPKICLLECAWMAVSRPNISDRDDTTPKRWDVRDGLLLVESPRHSFDTVSLLPSQNYTQGQRKVAFCGHQKKISLYVYSNFAIGSWITISLNHFGSIY